MKISVLCSDLQEALRKVKPVVKDGHSVEALQFFRMKLDPGKGLSITGSDMEIFLSHTIPAKADEVCGFLISAKMFTELVMLLNADERIECELSEANQKVIIRAEVKKYSLSYIKEEEYVEIPNYELSEIIEVDGKKLKQALNYVDYAVDDGDIRPAFTGIKLERDENNQLVCVATDGKKLSRFVTDMQTGNISLIIPQKASDILKTIIPNEPINIGIISGMLMFKTETIAFYARLIKANFPDYQAILPTDSPINFVANTKELLTTVKNLLKLADKNKKRVIFSLSDEGLYLTVYSEDINEQRVKQEVISSCGKIEIGVQGIYLIDTLSAIQEKEVRFEMSTPTKAIKITAVGNDAGLNIVMPVRLG